MRFIGPILLCRESPQGDWSGDWLTSPSSPQWQSQNAIHWCSHSWDSEVWRSPPHWLAPRGQQRHSIPRLHYSKGEANQANTTLLCGILGSLNLHTWTLIVFITKASCFKLFSGWGREGNGNVFDLVIIPQGTEIFPILNSALFDPRYFDTPDTFNPDHFLDATGALKKNESFIPFSTGELDLHSLPQIPECRCLPLLEGRFLFIEWMWDNRRRRREADKRVKTENSRENIEGENSVMSREEETVKKRKGIIEGDEKWGVSCRHNQLQNESRSQTKLKRR